jgi:putative ABC transport system ATP-binding protein
MLICLRRATRTYPAPDGAIAGLRAVDLEIGRGEMLAIVGQSGSGKSTLLNLVAGIDRPSQGEVLVGGCAVHALSEGALARWRGRTVGVVFQFFQLLPTLTTVENVMLPMDFAGLRPARDRRPRALELLALVGVQEQADKLPAALSGGQQQRVAIARALANDPPIVTADEPTGNLDSATAGAVLDLFRTLADRGTTVVIATHERDIARVADRRVELRDGRVAAPSPGTAPARGRAGAAR